MQSTVPLRVVMTKLLTLWSVLLFVTVAGDLEQQDAAKDARYQLSELKNGEQRACIHADMAYCCSALSSHSLLLLSAVTCSIIKVRLADTSTTAVCCCHYVYKQCIFEHYRQIGHAGNQRHCNTSSADRTRLPFPVLKEQDRSARTVPLMYTLWRALVLSSSGTAYTPISLSVCSLSRHNFSVNDKHQLNSN
jgi:hypothetical protein